MQYLQSIYFLSDKFSEKYPNDIYPEIMQKDRRPYACLLIETQEDYFICVPFRSNINHNNAFLFRNSHRSRTSRSGLDYSKIVLIEDISYLSDKDIALVDDDEYKEMKNNLDKIVMQVFKYINTYKNHIIGVNILDVKQFERKYKYSTLKYFHNMLMPKS